MAVVNENVRGLQKDCRKSNRGRPRVDTLYPCVSAKKSDDGWDKDEILGNNDGGAHVYFQMGILKPSRNIQSEPCGIKGGATRQVGQ